MARGKHRQRGKDERGPTGGSPRYRAACTILLHSGNGRPSCVVGSRTPMFVLQQAPDFAPTRASTRHDHEAGRRPMLTYRTLTRSAMVLGCAGLIAGCGSSPAGQNRRPGGNAVPIQTTGTKRITVQRQVDLAGTLLAP